jgi:hypothetical protein
MIVAPREVPFVLNRSDPRLAWIQHIVRGWLGVCADWLHKEKNTGDMRG